MTAPSQTRSRLQLLLIAALFLGSFGVAATLFFSGWKPGQTRNIGEMLEPYPDLRDIPLVQTAVVVFAFVFILLNLLLSCLAAIQAPVIMMSQNRQAAKDRL